MVRMVLDVSVTWMAFKALLPAPLVKHVGQAIVPVVVIGPPVIGAVVAILLTVVLSFDLTYSVSYG